MTSDAEELPPPTPPGMSISFSNLDNFPIILVISNLLINAKNQALFWAPHMYNSFHPPRNPVRQVLFQIGKLKHRKLAVYPGLVSRFEPTPSVFLTTSLIYHSFSLAPATQRPDKISTKMGRHFAQIIANPAKRHFILYFTEETFEAQKGWVTFLRSLSKLMVEPSTDTGQSDHKVHDLGILWLLACFQRFYTIMIAWYASVIKRLAKPDQHMQCKLWNDTGGKWESILSHCNGHFQAFA